MNPKYIFGLRQLLDETLKRCDFEYITEDRCVAIAIKISQKTQFLTGEIVLKRLYGYAAAKFNPSVYVLNALANFCGSPSFSSWQEQLAQAERSLPPHTLKNKDFNKLFYYSDYPMWIFETETLRFLEVNSAASSIYGYGHDQFLNMSLFDIRPVEDRQLLLEAVATAGEYTHHQQPFRHELANGEIVKADIISYDFKGLSTAARLVMPMHLA